MDGAAAAPMEREEGKADGSKVLELVVVCWCRDDVVLLVDVLYGTIFLHSYEMSPFPDIFLRGNEKKK